MKPYYEDSAVTIYHGDCREILPVIDQHGFCFTDPPYNVGMDYGAESDDALPDKQYLHFCKEWLSIIEDLCARAVFYPPKKYLLDFWKLIGSEFRQIIMTWRPEGAIRYGFVDQYAVLLTNVLPIIRTKNWWENCQMRGMGYFFKENDFGHPGYTSEDVTGRVLAHLHDPADVVIDPFMGTGTTLRVAKNIGGRIAIGCEISERYCEIAARRMEQEVLPFAACPQREEADTPALFQMK